MSQNSELAFNRIEFLYDGEVKAYSNGTEIFDSETEEQIFELPKYDFTFLDAYYRLNDIYDKNSLFSIIAGYPMKVEEIIAEMNKNLFSEFELSDGRSISMMHFFEYCDTYVKYHSIFLSGEILAEDNCYDEIMQSLFFPALLLNKLQGQKIITATNSIKRQKNNSSNLTAIIDNPAVVDLDTAKVVRDWMYEQIEHSAYSIDTDWRGDCSLELGDEATAEIAITQNGVKDYESRYIGVVVKNIIEYNGALKMQTTLYSPSQKRWNDTTLCDTSTKVSASLKV